MRQTILDISNSFIEEALSSPRMLEDLAAMERYMSESYDGRTFVELLQNADDAGSKKVRVLLAGDALVVANDGRPFDEADIMAICRSGASSKQRGEGIGYRGVGFKSATAISSEIVIHSAGECFSFSKSACAELLGKSESQVPTVRIPFLVERQTLGHDANEAIDSLKSEGFTTFFVFIQPRVEKLVGELDDFGSGWLLFLKNVSDIRIECGTLRKGSSISRKRLASGDALLSVCGGKEQWYVVSRDSVSAAFRFDPAIGVQPCLPEEAVFHCFLPTLDKTGYPFKVNADFSTDPSRKHVIQDEVTSKAMSDVQDLLSDVAARATRDLKEHLYPIASLMTQRTTLNPLVVSFECGLMDRLRSKEWVPLNDGRRVKPEHSKLLPKWIDSHEGKTLSDLNLPVTRGVVEAGFAEKAEKVDTLLGRLGSQELEPKEISEILADINSVQKIPKQLIGKIFTQYYRASAMDEKAVANLFIPLEKGYDQLSNISRGMALDDEFALTAKSLLNDREKSSLSIAYDAFAIFRGGKSETPRQAPDETGPSTGKPVLSRWKTPIQNCITLETLNGNTVKKADKKEVAFDLVSSSPSGEVSYISVKTVDMLGDSFRLTEGEHDAALQYGDQYKVYLLSMGANGVDHIVVTNPITSMQMKKVVKEWEWICSSHDVQNAADDNEGEGWSEALDDMSHAVTIDAMDGADFERYCARILAQNGYENVSLTKASGDQGIDVIAYKDGIKIGVQCKRYSSDIGNKAVQEAFAGKVYYGCTVGAVITNQHFSPSAIQLAESNGIVLWDREALLRFARNASKH